MLKENIKYNPAHINALIEDMPASESRAYCERLRQSTLFFSASFRSDPENNNYDVFSAFAWRPRFQVFGRDVHPIEQYRGDGLEAFFNNATRQLLMVAYSQYTIHAENFIENKGHLYRRGLVNTYHIEDYERAFGEEGKDTLMYLLNFETELASNIHLWFYWNDVDQFHFCSQDYRRAFGQDLNEAFFSYIKQICPEAAACFTPENFNTWQFNWLASPADPQIRQRRCKAFSKLTDIRDSLFTRQYLHGNHRAHILTADQDITTRIDRGGDIFDIMGEQHDLPPDFIRSKVSTLGPNASHQPNIFALLKLMQILPWFQLPKTDLSSFDTFLRFPPGSAPTTESAAYYDVTKSIGRILEIIASPDLSDRQLQTDTIGMRTNILVEIFAPQMREIEAGASPSWLEAFKEMKRMEDRFGDIKNLFQETTASMGRHLFAPLIILSMQRRGIATFTEQQLRGIDRLARSCSLDLLGASEGSEFLKLPAVRDIDRIVTEFSKFSSEHDPSLERDPTFQYLGVKLSDDDTQQNLFEMYRDRVLDSRWQHCQTLNEFLVESGLTRKVSGIVKRAVAEIIKAAP